MKHFKAVLLEAHTGLLLKVFGKAYTPAAFKATVEGMIKLGAYGTEAKVVAVVEVE